MYFLTFKPRKMPPSQYAVKSSTSYSKGKPPKELGDLRFEMFSKRAAAGNIRPEKLPPTTAAAAQHSLRSYLQTRHWLLLQSPSLDALDYGWKLGGEGYAPVPTTDPTAPDYLLGFSS